MGLLLHRLLSAFTTFEVGCFNFSKVNSEKHHLIHFYYFWLELVYWEFYCLLLIPDLQCYS